MMHRRTIIVGFSVAGIIAAAAGAFVLRPQSGGQDSATAERKYRAKVERVRSGHKVKLKSGKTLVYAGIRSPFPNEHLHAEAHRRNAELVEGKKVRLRFDDKDVAPPLVGGEDAGSGEQMKGYVFVDGLFVNEALVSEGLAYVRLTPTEKRFADQLLKAQKKARRYRRGLWKHMKKSSESSYPAGIKYGNFHRPSCEEVAKKKPERLRVFRGKRQAFDAGFAPCAKCSP